MRSIALDVHRDFCEVAIKEAARCARRGGSRPSVEELELFARQPGPDDQVALEATGPRWRSARIIEPHVAEVVVANTSELRAIAEAQVKTDKVDARTLWRAARRGSSARGVDARRAKPGRCAGVWGAGPQLVRSRTRAKNEIHAALTRNLKGRPPMSDVFGRKGRRWLAGLELPADEREIGRRGACARSISWTQRSRRSSACSPAEALDSEEIKRLMTVPGVNVIVGRHVRGRGRRHRPLRQPAQAGRLRRARPAGAPVGRGPARHGRISKQGSARGPPHAVRVRPGSRSASPARCAPSTSACAPAAATGRARRDRAQARVLFWHLLTRDEDYAYEQPSLTRQEAAPARAPRRRAARAEGSTRDRSRPAKRDADGRTRARRAGRVRLPTAWSPTGSTQAKRNKGAGATPGRASKRPSSGQATRQVHSPRACALARRHRRPDTNSHKRRQNVQPSLTFIRRPDREPGSAPSGVLLGLRKRACRRRRPPGFWDSPHSQASERPGRVLPRASGTLRVRW